MVLFFLRLVAFPSGATRIGFRVAGISFGGGLEAYEHHTPARTWLDLRFRLNGDVGYGLKLGGVPVGDCTFFRVVLGAEGQR